MLLVFTVFAYVLCAYFNFQNGWICSTSVILCQQQTSDGNRLSCVCWPWRSFRIFGQLLEYFVFMQRSLLPFVRSPTGCLPSKPHLVVHYTDYSTALKVCRRATPQWPLRRRFVGPWTKRQHWGEGDTLLEFKSVKGLTHRSTRVSMKDGSGSAPWRSSTEGKRPLTSCKSFYRGNSICWRKWTIAMSFNCTKYLNSGLKFTFPWKSPVTEICSTT